VTYEFALPIRRINDEISQDLAAPVSASHGIWHGMDRAARHVEQNLLKLDAKESRSAPASGKIPFGVTDIASPLFKWTGQAHPIEVQPEARSVQRRLYCRAQDEVSSAALSWPSLPYRSRPILRLLELDDQAPYRAAMNEKLRNAAKKQPKGCDSALRK